MFFTILMFSILVCTLVSRATRGERIKNKPRGLERIFVRRFWGKTIHIHHSYWGIIVLPLGYFWSVWISIGLALIISDIIFHIAAHVIWNDPIWD